MVQDSRGVNDVERARAQTRPQEIRFNELHALDAKPTSRCGAERQRRARQVGANDHAVRAREVEAHLAGPAADLDDSRIAGNGAIEQADELAASRARAKRGQVVMGRIPGKWGSFVEAAHRFRARVTGQSKIGNAVRCLVRHAARDA